MNDNLVVQERSAHALEFKNTDSVVSVAGASRRRPQGRIVSQVEPPEAAAAYLLPAEFVIARLSHPGVLWQEGVWPAELKRESGRAFSKEYPVSKVVSSARALSGRPCPGGELPKILRHPGSGAAGSLSSRVQPNLSLKPSPNGGPPGPGHRYGVHFLWPGPGGPPLGPA